MVVGFYPTDFSYGIFYKDIYNCDCSNFLNGRFCLLLNIKWLFLTQLGTPSGVHVLYSTQKTKCNTSMPSAVERWYFIFISYTNVQMFWLGVHHLWSIQFRQKTKCNMLSAVERWYFIFISYTNLWWKPDLDDITWNALSLSWLEEKFHLKFFFFF
jgi:hypothetical protein